MVVLSIAAAGIAAALLARVVRDSTIEYPRIVIRRCDIDADGAVRRSVIRTRERWEGPSVSVRRFYEDDGIATCRVVERERRRPADGREAAALARVGRVAYRVVGTCDEGGEPAIVLEPDPSVDAADYEMQRGVRLLRELDDGLR